ncbi:MAG: TIGR04255 family protein [Planctomycetes bacterium]|nr:TIGR04255 family protein [Planctomycetota bacterium]
MIYRKNPLAEVICQLRFPPILRIDSELPAAFQERIRADYPHYTESVRPSLKIPPNAPAEVVKLLQSVAAQGAPAGHEFGAADKNWTVTLTRDFLALRTTAYERWEAFHPRIDRLLSALTTEYKPSFFTRIGLRYVDVIRRSELGLGDTPWADLLNPYVAGELASPDIGGEIDTAVRETLLRFDDDGGRVMIKHGLATVETEKEPCFAIDADFFVEGEMETINAITILDRFNQGAGRLFRWCIDDQLHEALEPDEIGA